MAIALDNSAKATSFVSNTTVSAFNVAASATLLLGCVVFRGTADNLTSLKWNGSNMTFYDKVQNPVGNGWAYLYYTLSPTTGSHDMLATLSSNPSSDALDVYAYSLKATSTSAFPNAGTHLTSTGAGPISISVTSTVGNCWFFLLGENENAAVSAGTNSTLRQNQHGSGIFDTNGPKAAGSLNMQASYGAGNNWCGIMVAIAPSVTTTSLTETITTSDSIPKTTARALTETITDSDTLTSARILVRSFTDTLTTIDSLVRSAGRVLAETLTTSDTFIRSTFRSFSETITSSEVLQRLIGRNLSESVTTQDSVIRTAARTLTDTITTVDSFIRAAFRVLSETITTSDVIAKVKTARITLSETLTLLEKKIRPLVNGILGWYSSKYTARGSSYNSKYTTRGTTHQRKYE